MNTLADKLAIEKLLSLYADAVNASDISKTLALYINDGVLMPNGAASSKGQEQLTTAYEALYKAFQLNVEYVMDEVIVNGEYAYARTHSKGNTLVRATRETLPVNNKELFILNKSSTQWKIAHYIFNNNIK